MRDMGETYWRPEPVLDSGGLSSLVHKYMEAEDRRATAAKECVNIHQEIHRVVVNAGRPVLVDTENGPVLVQHENGSLKFIKIIDATRGKKSGV